MSLLDVFRRRPKTSARYLRAIHTELAGIRSALEHQNDLWAAGDPAAAQATKGPKEEVPSSVTYVDHFVVHEVEKEQARVFELTGKLEDQDVIYERLIREGRIES